VIDASRDDAVEAVRDLTSGGADYAFEAIGRPETIELALQLTGRGGHAILVGMAPPDARVPIDPLTLTLEERGVRGCWYGSTLPSRDFPLLVELYRSGRLTLDAMIETCALDDVNEAFRRMQAGETARSVIVYG
jgi:Zn-dependent alcohol dehydrogenase